ncbi:hypothetical protein BCR44DRAFT_1433870 [Catenaria anguillulae PL171]|uniref:UspA domain-containing protein n=1 Tax=Catenaria anguillulae PL171 TaxID=765915 RepID=A0A1Y2HNT4_9FUNG|nr:hypothetical protein BCR44DRAFT_1433870 [Catenaria anguillulae PL171]
MDDSTASQAALTWTLNQLVSPSRDHLIILTVAHYKTAGLLKTNEEKTARRELKAEEQAQIVVNYAAAHIAQWIESLKISLSFELVTLKAADGKVQEVITDYARDINSNVLILGSHAGGAIRKTLFGSTATYCLTHATTPVIVVREEGTVMAA